MKVKKGDKVIVISGKDKGKQGKILVALPSIEKVIVEGVNMKKKHQRPTRSNQKGQTIEKAMPVHVSNVMSIDSVSGKPVKTAGKKSSEVKKPSSSKEEAVAQ